MQYVNCSMIMRRNRVSNSLTVRQYPLYTKFTKSERGRTVDDEWLALIIEAKALGLTVEDVREWIAWVNSEEEEKV